MSFLGRNSTTTLSFIKRRFTLTSASSFSLRENLCWRSVFANWPSFFRRWITIATHKMLTVIMIRVSKMISHCSGTVQMREESESGIGKWEEMWFKTTAEDGESGAAVTCDGRLFHGRAAATGNALSPTVDRRVRRTSRDVDEAEPQNVVVIWLWCLLIVLKYWHVCLAPAAQSKVHTPGFIPPKPTWFYWENPLCTPANNSTRSAPSRQISNTRF